MDKNIFYIIGLDIETSSSDLNYGEILQLGVSYKINEEYYSTEYNIFFDKLIWHDLNWSKESENVHKITKKSLTKNKDTYDSVQSKIINLLNNTFGEESIIVPVGFNVGSFDLQFIKSKMPILYKRLSYRVIDLNSLFLYKSLSNYDYNEFIEIKKNAKLDIIESLSEKKEHNASYDAMLALLILEKF
jgi:oligoribonuclease (3'-5' exoribonuclease)